MRTPDLAAVVDPLSVFRLDNQVVIITGASSGLGARFARLAHAVGAQVVIAARRIERLQQLVNELPGAVAVVTDVSVAADRQRLVATTIERFGRVDVLVNNAGISSVNAIENEDLETFRNVMEVNAIAVWHLCKLAGAAMADQGYGSIVNVASMLGHVGSSPVKQANYCASKGAVVNLTRELGAQWGRKGIHINALCPGWFPSELTADMHDEASQRFITTHSPIPRMGFEHELDGAFLLLASKASTYMTGQSLIVDGGWTAR
jgi:NAD(P)-dependent dehydrogenase (short-subunit alcohol dehydrogenase family)